MQREQIPDKRIQPWQWLIAVMVLCLGVYVVACIPELQCSSDIPCAREKEVCVAGQCLILSENITPPDSAPERQVPDDLPGGCLPTKPYFRYAYDEPIADPLYQRIAFHPQDLQLAVGTQKGVIVWDISPTSKPTERKKLATSTQVTGLAYVPDHPSRLAYTALNERQIRLWSIEDDKESLWDSAWPILALAYVPALNSLFAGFDNGAVWRWKAHESKGSEQFVHTPKGDEGSLIFKLQFVPAWGSTTPRLMVGRIGTNGSGTEQKRYIETWAISTGWSMAYPAAAWTRPPNESAPLQDFSFIPGTISFSVAHLQGQLFTAKTDDTYNKQDLVPKSKFDQKYHILSTTYRPGGDWVAMGSNQGDIRMIHWRATPSYTATSVKVDTDDKEVIRLAWSWGGNYLAASTKTHLHVWTCP